MKFINPSFLWALFALAIPVIIHLFHFRRYKTLYFSNVNFLKEVKQERNNIRQLKRWLLLLSRLLALFFLVSAFARPYFQGKDKAAAGPTAVSIYIDNSYSMGLKNKGVELMEWGRERALDVVRSYNERDEFMVITNDLKVEEQRWKSKEDAISYINNVQSSAKSIPLSTILGKQDYLFSKSNGVRLKNYIISDFQESAIRDVEIAKDSLQSHYFIHLQADNVKNIYVDSVWMIDPVNMIGNGNSVLYKIKNSSELDARDIRVTLKINDQVQTIRELNLTSEEERIDTLYFNIYKKGWQLAEIGITDYPITVDDVFYFSFDVKKTNKVLEIYDGTTPNVIRSVFSQDDFVNLTRKKSNQLDYSSFQNYDLIILNELEKVSSGLISSVEQYIIAGGNTLLVPSASAQKETYENLLATSIGIRLGAAKTGNYKLMKPNLSNRLLSGIVAQYPSNTVMPNVKKYFPILAGSRIRQQNILKLNNGESLLSAFPKGNGYLFVQSVPNQASFSEFQSHWSYAPIIYNIALTKGLGKQLYLINGKEEWVAIENKIDRKDNVVSITGEEVDFIPEQRIVNNRLFINTSKNDQITAGHYKASLNEEVLAYLSVNLNRLESEMKFAETEELATQFPNVDEISSGIKDSLVQSIKLNNEGRPLWRWCILLALLFVIVEVAIIKLMPN